MNSPEHEHIMADVRRRILDTAGLIAFLLAAVQGLAYLTSWGAQWQHGPIGKFVRVDDAQLHYLDVGAGKPIVLLPGNDGLIQDFTVWLVGALKHNYRVIAFDRPGHGYSSRPSNVIATADVQAKQLHEALQKLGVHNPVLLGHSWGGMLALDYAIKYPGHASALVLLSPLAYSGGVSRADPSDHAEMIPVFGDVLISLFVISARRQVELNTVGSCWPAKLPADYITSYAALVLRPGQIKAYAEDNVTAQGTLDTISPRYGEIKIPVYIVSGALDAVVDPKTNSYPLHKAIKQSSLTIIPQAGHQLELIPSPAVLAAIKAACRQSRSF